MFIVLCILLCFNVEGNVLKLYRKCTSNFLSRHYLFFYVFFWVLSLLRIFPLQLWIRLFPLYTITGILQETCNKTTTEWRRERVDVRIQDQRLDQAKRLQKKRFDCTWVLWSCCDHGAHRCTETGMMDSVHRPPTPSTEWGLHIELDALLYLIHYCPRKGQEFDIPKRRCRLRQSLKGLVQITLEQINT